MWRKEIQPVHHKPTQTQLAFSCNEIYSQNKKGFLSGLLHKLNGSPATEPFWFPLDPFAMIWPSFREVTESGTLMSHPSLTVVFAVGQEVFSVTESEENTKLQGHPHNSQLSLICISLVCIRTGSGSVFPWQDGRNKGLYQRPGRGASRDDFMLSLQLVKQDCISAMLKDQHNSYFCISQRNQPETAR